MSLQHTSSSYVRSMVDDKKSMAVASCSKILFEVGPASIKAKKGLGDKVWKLYYPYNKGSKLEMRVAFVCTYKDDGAIFTQAIKGNKINLTVQYASLLSVRVLGQISPSQKPPIILLTPLAGAVFSRDNIQATILATHLTL